MLESRTEAAQIQAAERIQLASVALTAPVGLHRLAERNAAAATDGGDESVQPESSLGAGPPRLSPSQAAGALTEYVFANKNGGPRDAFLTAVEEAAVEWGLEAPRWGGRRHI
eukprot:TRINITY_DN1722_c0_g1_i8.p1 TRINITY_DN1722_c0_g1~~TRINITY_DN1722_c0_g1_i8.p1  ORF type:complete len:112 (-),score=7.29 TRINITY_DN1722_c0_g1_i8:225-560(-)